MEEWTLQANFYGEQKNTFAKAAKKIPTPAAFILVGAHTPRFKEVKRVLLEALPEGRTRFYTDDTSVEKIKLWANEFCVFEMSEKNAPDHAARHEIVEVFHAKGLNVAMLYVKHNPDALPAPGQLPSSRVPLDDPEAQKLTDECARKLFKDPPNSVGLDLFFEIG